MKKTVRKFNFFVAPLFLLLCMTVGLAACINSYVAKLRYNWDINLPNSMNLVYNCEDEGFGDGSYFYVYETEFDSLDFEFVPMDKENAEKIDKACETLLSDLDKDYYLNWEHDCVYHYQSKNGEWDYIYLIYDKDNSMLYICEIIM